MTLWRRVGWMALFGLPLALLAHWYADVAVARWAIAQGDALSKPFDGLSRLAESHYWLVPSVLLWIYWRWIRPRPQWALRALFMWVAIAFSGLAVNVIKIIFGKARPLMLRNEDFFGFTWFNVSPDFASFPSGHTTTAFTIATVLALLFPRYWVWFYMYGLLMALSRVFSWWHYPSDVMTGALFGTVATVWLFTCKRLPFHTIK